MTTRISSFRQQQDPEMQHFYKFYYGMRLKDVKKYITFSFNRHLFPAGINLC